MQRGINHFVISRENNVVRVDFSRDPDPPTPRFPGATGLRVIGDESASETKYIVAGALKAVSPLSAANNEQAQVRSAGPLIATHRLRTGRGL